MLRTLLCTPGTGNGGSGALVGGGGGSLDFDRLVAISKGGNATTGGLLSGPGAIGIGRGGGGGGSATFSKSSTRREEFVGFVGGCLCGGVGDDTTTELVGMSNDGFNDVDETGMTCTTCFGSVGAYTISAF